MLFKGFFQFSPGRVIGILLQRLNQLSFRIHHVAQSVYKQLVSSLHIRSFIGLL
jgi:hypothetical protein